MVTEVYDALNRYFNILSHTGYKSYDNVYSLITFIFMNEFIEGPFTYYITEEDYDIISKAMYCLYGTCLIPYPSYRKGVEGIKRKDIMHRISESDVIRETEDFLLREKS